MTIADTSCPLDGNLRRITHRDATAVVYKCSWCGQVTRESLDPVADGLQRSINR